MAQMFISFQQFFTPGTTKRDKRLLLEDYVLFIICDAIGEFWW